MVRTQLVLGETQRERLEKLARENGVSISALVREMIDRELARREESRLRSAAEKLRSEYINDRELNAFSSIEVEGLDDEG